MPQRTEVLRKTCPFLQETLCVQQEICSAWQMKLGAFQMAYYDFSGSYLAWLEHHVQMLAVQEQPARRRAVQETSHAV